MKNSAKIEEAKKAGAREIIKDTIDSDAVVAYLSAEFGAKIGVYANGNWAVGEDVGLEIAVDERPIAVATCPGIGNIDGEGYTEGLEDLEDDTYRLEDGRIVDLVGAIQGCADNWGLIDEVEDLVDELARDAEMAEER